MTRPKPKAPPARRIRISPEQRAIEDRVMKRIAPMVVECIQQTLERYPRAEPEPKRAEPADAAALDDIVPRPDYVGPGVQGFEPGVHEEAVGRVMIAIIPRLRQTRRTLAAEFRALNALIYEEVVAWPITPDQSVQSQRDVARLADASTAVRGAMAQVDNVLHVMESMGQ